MNTTLVASLAGSAAVLGLGYWAYQRQFGWRTPFPKEYRKGKEWKNTFTQQRTSGTHGAVDVGLPTGTPIYAAKRGTVIGVSSDCGDPPGTDGHRCTCGHGVTIKHPGGKSTVYCHLDQAPSVKYGDKVKKGQQLGVSGNTGNSYSPHLHFAVLGPGGLRDPLNPEKYVRIRKVNIASIAAWSVAAVAMSAGLVVAGRMVFDT
jgi:murein DD-endopeptidase MepM/ murein hydrolase activator NlpD